MAQNTLHFYIPPWLFDQVQRPGTIFGRVAQAAQLAGWNLQIHGEDDPRPNAGYHLVYNRPVDRPNMLVVRKCGFEPFFRIETTNDRWDWDVSQTRFATDKGGEWFRSYWQGELFKGQDISKAGYVFMPLQGRLLLKRHFQSASPIDMITQALLQEPKLPIMATLHPNETYSAEELAALADLSRQSGGQFQLSQDSSIKLLAGCNYVVTQNSTMALVGMFAAKMPILFAEIDFHHLAGSVPHIGIARAYGRLNKPRRWGAYLHWYFKENAISVRDDTAPKAILVRMAQLGWPISADAAPRN